ncbi:malic enzyme-related [Holotrichia oblita]|uniref:Malic enzyme-related n=2 Tax=Holotrichia oblita TaxID=644536 RepID=A0ACB9SQB4_HOLOL|nr:malic enzyme-related [Holotrichia oblita]KAI4455930.1 malic enzyme-related [Holotrichia oblita]
MLTGVFLLSKIPRPQLDRRKYAPSLKVLIKRVYSMGAQGEVLSFGATNGMDHMNNRTFYKDVGFTIEERFALGIHGLLPGRVETLPEQVNHCIARLNMIKDDLDKYIYLSYLHSTNEKLFFSLLTQNVNKLIPIVYTPTVARAVKNHGLVAGRTKALYITIHDKGHIAKILDHWPERDVIASVVTDGERCLGLGDMGLNSVLISVGKMGLYTAFAGVKPHLCMPVVLDAGTNNQTLLESPYYLGIRQKRVTGPEYDEFVDEFMRSVVQKYGQKMLVQFEDFGIRNAFKYLQKYQNKYCCFNDDIQGTGAVVLAGFYAARRILDRPLKSHKYLFLGAGSATIGTANITCAAMVAHEGVTIEEARERICMFDLNGLVTTYRTDLNEQQKLYAINHPPINDFLKVIEIFKPSVLIGLCTVGSLFTPDILKLMGKINKKPLIFALSNPNSHAECTPLDAYKHTEGRAIYASGSPFGEVEYNGEIYRPGQGNNAYIYPGLALGAIVGAVHHISDEIQIIAARCVSDLVTDEDIRAGSIYPPMSKVREISDNIALKMLEHGISKKLCSLYPLPKDLKQFIRAHQYDLNYEKHLPARWSYPDLPPIKVRKLSEDTYNLSLKCNTDDGNTTKK